MGAKWVVMTMDCVWAIGEGLFGIKQLYYSVTRLAVTLFQLSHRAACSNNQHCLYLPTFYCTSVSTMSLDTPAHQVIIIAVTDGYTGFLSVPLSVFYHIRLLCAQEDEQ